MKQTLYNLQSLIITLCVLLLVMETVTFATESGEQGKYRGESHLMYSYGNMHVGAGNFRVATGLPILKGNSEYSPQTKDEKHYPNGTFVGKYAYVDDKGNPVQVKYYADDSSYGVELKSVKVFEAKTKEPLLQATALDILGSNLEPIKVASDLLKINYRILGNEAISPYKYLNKEVGKIKSSKGDEGNSDYEVFYQKELSAPKKCNKDKVRVFFDKKKRWV